LKAIIITVIMLTNVLNFELAVTEKEKETGMMFRKNWGKIDGMVFINREPREVSYWMKNTYLPMVMLFADKNMKILEAYQPEPLSTSLVFSSNTNIKYVVEIKPELTNIINKNPALFGKKIKEKLQDEENIRLNIE
jgi:uncharacterized membrane protein (UPF0127 family)